MKKLTLTRSAGFWLTILITALIIAWHFQALIANLGAMISLEPYRDGIKTPVNAAYHALYDKSLALYEGMNYPYAEHIVAATELPGMAIGIQLLRPVFPSITDYVFGIAHAIILISILLCALFLYLIFIKLRMPVWYAVLVAVGLTFLAPQHFRMFPHMGLAPVFVLPAIIYGLLQFEEKPRIWNSIFLGLTVVIASLLHFYFFAITVFTIGLYLFFSLMRDFNWQRMAQMAFHFTIMVLLPLALFYFWMVANDPVTDRSPKPWGFFVYNAKWESIFLSMQMPLYQWIDDKIITIEKTDFEGWSYVGIVAGVFVLALIFRWARSRFKHPILNFFNPAEKNFYYPMLWTGVVLAVFSTSQPFATKGLEFLLDYTGPLQQFRSTGRFAWVFYFAINIIAFAGIFRLSQKWKIGPKAALLAGALFLLSYESFTFFTNKGIYSEDKFYQVEELLPGKRFTDIPGIDFSKYQAIIPIPYYNVGSNNFWSAGGGLTVQKSLVLSMQTGLPVTGAMLTRSSMRQCFDQMQLVTQPYRNPKVFQDYPNQKPLLLLYTQPATEEEKRRHDHLISGATLLHEGNGWTLYELRLESFEARIRGTVEQVKRELAERELFEEGELLYSYKESGFVYQTFDSLPNKKAYFGEGCYEGDIRKPNVLWNAPIPRAVSNGAYQMLAWVYVDEDLFAATEMRILEQNAAGEKVAEIAYVVSWQAETYDPNGWVLVECPFILNSAENKIIVSFQLKERVDGRLLVDELLLKPVISDVYHSNGHYLWKNGRHWNQ